MNETGLCECGCGGITKVANKNHTKSGNVKGKHYRFLRGHSTKNKFGKDSPQWKGGTRVMEKSGRKGSYNPKHPKAQHGYIRRSWLIAEKALGHLLPEGALVHHVNEDPADDSPGNLVICEDQAYHMLLHRRKRAYDACGNASWRKCPFCKEYDDIKNLHERKTHFLHQECENKYARDKRKTINQSRDLRG